MNSTQQWLNKIENWSSLSKHQQIDCLEELVLNTPTMAFYTQDNNDQPCAVLRLWLDACLRLFEHYKKDNETKALSLLHLAYAKMQFIACNSQCSLEHKRFAIAKLQPLIVIALEFCNQQIGHHWEEESHKLIEEHVQFMTANNWNDDQGVKTKLSNTH
ncbi:transcriptional regulator [Vibrio sp.]|nr:transcriptional regulator [Vibrio sp.]